MFSRRAHWNAAVNQLTIARQHRGDDLLDLTLSNPTRAGIDYPLDELSDALARGARAAYDPDPRGLASAREALARELQCHPDDLLLTASTSEAYSFLFKLLCDPGDAVLTATPSYPLFEHLAALELIELQTFPLEFHRRWEIDPARIRAALTPRTRAIAVVNPNNPTGSFVTEQDDVASVGLPVISDEVFRDYPLNAPPAPTFVRDDVPTFVLGGLSKGAGLPHYKLGWIRVSGPAEAKRDALNALELIADNFLSVATPVQAALPELLALAPRIRARISERTRANLASLRAALPPSIDTLPVEGGWSAVLRVPRTRSDEELAIELIEKQGVAVYPGYFFDFASEGYLVVSLLPPRETFDEGIRRLIRAI